MTYGPLVALQISLLSNSVRFVLTLLSASLQIFWVSSDHLLLPCEVQSTVLFVLHQHMFRAVLAF